MSSSNEPRPLRVVLAPFYPSNPYQTQLRDGLRERGVELGIGTPRDGSQPLDRLLDWRRRDLLHLHWLHQFCLAPELEASKQLASDFLKLLRRFRKKGGRLVWTVHNLVNHERRHPEVEHRVQRKLAKLADCVIVHTPSSGARLRRHLRLPELPFRVIPHANYVDAYPNEVTAEEARAQLGIEADRFVLLCLGNIRRYKGVENLLEAFRRARCPEGSRLLVAGQVGDAAEEERLRKAADSIPGVMFFPGFVEPERIQVFMNAADGVILPYREILTSGAALLAMSFGRPIIAPRIGDFREVVGKEGGILYSPLWNGLKRGLERAARRRDRLPLMGARNLERALEWSPDRIVDQHLALYEELIGRSTKDAFEPRT